MPDKIDTRRLVIFGAFLGACVLVLIIFLFIRMVLSGDVTDAGGSAEKYTERGPILDRNGVELALQPELYSVEAWVPHVQNLPETAGILASILRVSRESILAKFEGKTGSVILAHQITPGDSEKIQEYRDDGKLTGIYLKPRMGRIYPQQELGCHLLGYVNVDNMGAAGIEYTQNKELDPSRTGSPAFYGNQVYLTIDVNLQYKMDKIALEALQTYKAESVMIMAMEARTGEILAYTAAPRFNPNEYSRYSEEQRMNRPVNMAFEPGSTFKIFSIATLLETGAIKSDDVFHCNGYFTKTVGSETIKIKCLGEHGDVTAAEILKYSCNAGAAYASEKAASLPFYEKLREFGFGQKTGIALAGESAGIFGSPGNWSSRSKDTITFGQEISVSAIQMVSAATALANNGIMLRPQVVKKIVSPDGRTVLREAGREEVRRVISPSTASSVLAMMEGATHPGGWASAVFTEGLRIAAKTGTAQVPDPAAGGYSRENYIASVIGMFPVPEPRIILYVVIQNPKEGSYFGSRIAAPLFKKALDDILLYYDIPKAGDPSYLVPAQIKIPVPESIRIGTSMPDLQGVPKRYLAPLFETGLDVLMEGDGYVVSQNPSPGTTLRKGMKISLILK